jgi:dTDP-4-dehydrorhamnose 3,5-epimerase
MLHIPKGCAHGYLALADATDVAYHVSAPHSPDHARGFRWNDPTFGIVRPADPLVISQRDAAFSDFRGWGTTDVVFFTWSDLRWA